MEASGRTPTAEEDFGATDFMEKLSKSPGTGLGVPQTVPERGVPGPGMSLRGLCWGCPCAGGIPWVRCGAHLSRPGCLIRRKGRWAQRSAGPGPSSSARRSRRSTRGVCRGLHGAICSPRSPSSPPAPPLAPFISSVLGLPALPPSLPPAAGPRGRPAPELPSRGEGGSGAAPSRPRRPAEPPRPRSAACAAAGARPGPHEASRASTFSEDAVISLGCPPESPGRFHFAPPRSEAGAALPAPARADGVFGAIPHVRRGEAPGARPGAAAPPRVRCPRSPRSRRLPKPGGERRELAPSPQRARSKAPSPALLSLRGARNGVQIINTSRVRAYKLHTVRANGK